MIDWHFPRTRLAALHLGHFFDHGIARLAFFGRRRIGKTEYLQRDLIPEAEAKGVRTVYCSFWENKDQPHLALLRALHEAAPLDGVKAKAKFGLHLGVADASLEVERAERPRAALPGELTQLAQLFQRWVGALEGRPGLIVLDEIQHLATSAQFATFAASLRTLLDMAPPGLRVVFTGSSLVDLQRLFEEQKAAFFNFATVLDFPVLERPFIDHLVSIHQRITGQTLEADLLWEIFGEVGCNAQLVTGLVEQLVLRQSDDLAGLWAEFSDTLLGDDGWCARQWAELALSDQAVYLLLREGRELFAEESLALYERLGFSRGTAQKALARLINRSLLHRTGHGRYERIVPVLDKWLSGRGVTTATLVSPGPT